MKALVTGHTNGVGKWITDYLVKKRYQIVGYSRSSGQDITLPDIQRHLIEDLDHCHLFINNAHSDYAQVQLLKMASELWSQDETKVIINVGAGHFRPEIWQLVDNGYTAEKAALHALVQYLHENSHRCKIHLLRLGVMDTEECSPLDVPKIGQQELFYCLDFILSAPKNLNIESLTISAQQRVSI